MIFKRYFAVIGIASVLAGSSSADVVHLKDGTRIEGDVKHTDDGWTVRTKDKTIQVPADQLDSIELTGAGVGPAAAAGRLVSLRRSVENLTDLNDIIARFQRFVDANTDPTATADARKDLALWQDRQKQKMVKVGTKWVLPGDRQRLLDQSAVSAEQARQFMKQGRSKEAAALLADALLVDPQNASALYLTGVLKYQQELLPAARKSFEAVAALVPNHPATLNNLAVVQWRQRQYIPALANYDAAMLASPVNKQILDNVASAMLALPPELQKSPVTAKSLRHFQEQDQQLAEQMSQTGQHRYGAIWVADRDMSQMRQQEKQTQDQLDALAGDFDRSKGRIDQLDQNISDTQSQIHKIEATSVIGDATTGIPVQVPYPQVYYDLQRDLDRFQQERTKEVANLDGIKKHADNLQRNRPSQKMTGTQRIIGPEGKPLRVAPATRPA